MSSSYIPAKLADLVTWSSNFYAQCSATGTAHGLSAPQVTALGSAQNDLSTAYVDSSTPGTRTPVTVAATQTAKNAFLALAQPAAMILQASPTMDDAMRATYGITVPSGTRTPVPTPTAIPDLSIASISSSSITLRAKTLGSFGNAKPVGATSCRLYRKTGTTPPTSIGDATFIGVLTKRFFVDDVSALPAGTQVWYLGVFATNTGKVGPESSAITCNVSA